MRALPSCTGDVRAKAVHHGVIHTFCFFLSGELIQQLYRVYEQEYTHLCDDLCQAGVAHDQPAPGCDAIGLVLKLLGVNVIEIFEAEERRTRKALPDQDQMLVDALIVKTLQPNVTMARGFFSNDNKYKQG